MAIINYYYKNGRLRPLKKKNLDNVSILRMKILRNGKEFPCCDFHGKCSNKAYAEVYPLLIRKSKNNGWSYLCRKHYFDEQKRLNWKLPASLKVIW